MPTNRQIINFLGQYAIVVVLTIGVGFWVLHSFDKAFGPQSTLCDLSSLKNGETVNYRGHETIIVENADYSGNVWVRGTYAK